MHICISLYLDNPLSSFNFSKLLNGLSNFSKVKKIEKIYLLFYGIDETDLDNVKISDLFEIHIFSLSNRFANKNFFEELAFDCSLAHHCDFLYKLKVNQFDKQNLSNEDFEKIFYIQKINFLDHEQYLENSLSKDTKLRELKIFFYSPKLIRKNIYFLSETMIGKRINKNKKVPALIKNIYHYNFRTKLNLSRKFENEKLLLIFICGIVVKIYIFTGKLLPKNFTNLINSIIKKYFRKYINLVIFFEKSRVNSHTGLLQIAKYYVNSLTLIIIVRDFFRYIIKFGPIGR